MGSTTQPRNHRNRLPPTPRMTPLDFFLIGLLTVLIPALILSHFYR